MSLLDRLKNLITIDRGKDGLSITLLGVRVEIRDTPAKEKGWLPVNSGDGPGDRLWNDVAEEQQDALEAWLKNFVIRQIVRLTTAFVVGDGIEVSSGRPKVQKFIDEFWNDPANRMDERLPAWSDELVRSGELFPVLFSDTGPVRVADEDTGRPAIAADGMQFVRILPASIIGRVVTAGNDYETELGYHEIVPGAIDPREWKSRETAAPGDPCVLHYAVNRPVGATRGVGDLVPVLPWAKRYTEWLKDRVRLNRLRAELAAIIVKTKDPDKMEAYIRANPPKNGNITVVGENDSVEAIALNIGADDAELDGRALRLAIAAGSGFPLHFFAEGETTNRATASEMGDPTHRFLRMRQREIIEMVKDLVSKAYLRAAALRKGSTLPTYNGDLKIEVNAPDISRSDNKALAEAGKIVVEMFALMRKNGWIDDETAIRLAFRFLGEILDEDKIKEILEMPEAPTPEPEDVADLDDEALQAATDAAHALLAMGGYTINLAPQGGANSIYPDGGANGKN